MTFFFFSEYDIKIFFNIVQAEASCLCLGSFFHHYPKELVKSVLFFELKKSASFTV